MRYFSIGETVRIKDTTQTHKVVAHWKPERVVLNGGLTIRLSDLVSVDRPNKYDYVYIVQGRYGSKWEDVSAYELKSNARQGLTDYRLNTPYLHRIIQRREPLT